MSTKWISCGVCEEEFNVVAPYSTQKVAFCAFCGSEVDAEDDEENPIEEDED